MKILFIVPSYKPAYVYGGPIESVAKLCEGIVKAGHEVEVYTTAANGKTELDVTLGKKIGVDGVKVTYFKRITKDHTHISPALWQHLARTVKQYDIVHIQSWWSPLVIVAAYICYHKNVKLIVSPRGMLSNYIINSGKSKAKKIIHKVAGKFILSKAIFHATSDAEYKECIDLIPGWKGFMLPNILSLPPVPVNEYKNDVFTLIFMSRIHPKKGLEILFDAISQLKDPVKLKIAGSGEESYIDELKSLAKRLNISSKVEWLGWKSREEKFIELIHADLFTLISFNENFANVVIESLHVGTPVLVSENVALSDFVKAKDMGWVTTLDVNNVVAQLSNAINNKAKRLQIRQTGNLIIENNFAAEKLIADYINEYAICLSKN
ncbi:XrtY-associated glycosyltransferase XYAG1 [Mucilaginibacter jinjuensis]|uniref:Glycosyltransferase n=1 Tax=Mucilaginibacter jinjuensis TaxID=1176721 RepID=A0ABY7TDQ9_9SPHI|nr:glycosyltransferase [Mucilaginibacter jinjuensis]WCT13838.1 glycosyltransferase [Mucilaginibacter jinjuensis]